jgi:multiple sugar transport system permease protein
MSLERRLYGQRERRGRKRISWHRRRSLQGYLYVLPWIVGILFFFLYPMVYSAYISFTEWRAAGPHVWVGLQNYKLMLHDPLLSHSLKLTVTYTLLSVPLQMVVGMTMAYFLNQNVRGMTIFRTIYYMPSVLAGPAIAVLWGWIFSTEFGLINHILSLIGVPNPHIPWTTSREWVMWVYVIMSVWTVGHTIVIYLAGLQGIPTEYYEAAEVDGANRFQKVWSITLPLMMPIILYNLLLAIISSFQIFTTAYVLTNGTGRPANASLFYYLYMYRTGFREGYLGYASAMGWLLFAILVVVSILLFRVFRKTFSYATPTI